MEPNDAALRVLVIGGKEVAPSASLAALPDSFDLQFASAEKVLGASNGEDVAGINAVLLDAGSIASTRRKSLVRALVEALSERAPRTKLVALVGSKDLSTAAIAAESGAWDVATPRDRCTLEARLRAAAAYTEFEFEHKAGAEAQMLGGSCQMVGTSSAMRTVFSLIRQVGTTDVPVLIHGESGTGKELVALAIHERSHRSQGPFVPINCAAIPEALLESELFGYERGAFTGASRAARGMVEAADGGTLFLDEVGELAPGLQAKLLRFLEDHVVERLGGQGKRFSVDVRIIAATNRELTDAVASGEFREDLYYRLAVFPLLLPPLRERAEDVLLMARIFLQRYAAESERELRGFSPDAIDALWKSGWPGNVRELINRVRRAVVVAEGPLVTATDLGFDPVLAEVPLPTLREAVARVEVDCVRRALERSRHNRCKAASLLGISRSTLYELIHRHQLE